MTDDEAHCPAGGVRPLTVTFAAACLLVNLVLVLQPSLTFRINGPFFAFSLGEHLVLFVILAGPVVALLSLPGVAGSADWKSGYGALLAATAVALWAGSFVTPVPHASLDGSPLDLESTFASVLFNIGVLFAVAGGMYQLTRRRPRDSLFFLVLLNLLFLGMTAVAVVGTGLKAPTYDRGSDWATFSRSGNVMVVLLDTFQASLFERLVAERSELVRDFEGFTFHRNAVSPSPTTILSLPAIHSGRPLHPGERVSTYLTESIESDSFVARHARAGYRTSVLNPLLNLCPNGAACEHAKRVRGGYLRALAQESLQLVDLSLFAVLPLQWKQHVYRDGEWLFGDNPISPRQGYETLAWLTSSVKADLGPPTLKFVHLLTTHPPPVLGADCVPRREVPLSDEAMADQARCSIAAVGRLLRALKSQGVYDSSTIVVLGDHGAGISDVGFVAGGAASPLLLYKSAHAQGPLKTDQAVVPLTSVSENICRETGVCNPMPAASNTASRITFAHYNWPPDQWLRRDNLEVNFYEITGRPEDHRSWRRVGYPPPPVTKLDGTSNDPWGVYGPNWVDAPPRDGTSIRWAFGSEASLYFQLPERRTHRIRLEVAPFARKRAHRLAFAVNGERKRTVDLGAGQRAEVVLDADGAISSTAEIKILLESGAPADFSLEHRAPSFRVLRAAVD
jgi:hypothetical protein